MARTQPKQLDALTTAYGDLEKRVKARMDQYCRQYCSLCASTCCKADFCRESLDSPFLIALVKRFPPDCVWSEQRGWLTDHGCSLKAGRPPVCYAFFCGLIAVAQPTPMQLYSLSVLSGLMSYAGRMARTRRHLVELTDLTNLNIERLLSQFREAMVILDHLALFWADPLGNPLRLDLCRKVCRPLVGGFS